MGRELHQRGLYNLRVAPDGMMIDGKAYPPGNEFPEASIRIRPGTPLGIDLRLD